MKNKNNAHDAFFKSMMSHIDIAKDFFVQHVPVKISKEIDWDTLELMKETFISIKLNTSAADVIYRIKFKQRPGYLIFLIEHKSNHTKTAIFQIWRYIINFYQQQLKQQTQIPLPIIYPMLFYHGQSAYNGPNDFFEMFNPNQDLAKKFLLQPLKIIDLNQYEDEALAQANAASSFQLIMKHIHNKDLRIYLPKWGDLIKQAETVADETIRITILEYLTCKAYIPNETNYDKVVASIYQSKPRRIKMIMAKKWQKEGYLKGRYIGEIVGRAEGKAKGKAEGKAEGKANERKHTITLAKMLLKHGISAEQIVKKTDLSIEEIEAL